MKKPDLDKFVRAILDAGSVSPGATTPSHLHHRHQNGSPSSTSNLARSCRSPQSESHNDRRQRHLPRPHRPRSLAHDPNTITTWLADDLDTVITKQINYQGRSNTRSNESPWPMHLTASDASWDLINTLHAWIDTVVTQRHYPHPGRLRAAQAAKWLPSTSSRCPCAKTPTRPPTKSTTPSPASAHRRPPEDP